MAGYIIDTEKFSLFKETTLYREIKKADWSAKRDFFKKLSTYDNGGAKSLGNYTKDVSLLLSCVSKEGLNALLHVAQKPTDYEPAEINSLEGMLYQAHLLSEIIPDIFTRPESPSTSLS